MPGDMVGSQKWDLDERDHRLDNLKVSLNNIEKYFTLSFEVFHGDSFQAIVSQPECVAKAAVLLRADLLSHYAK